MKYKISHETHYVFSKEVFLEPHFLRFKPKITPFTELLSYELQLSIDPAGMSEQVDAENNLVHMCWFDGMHKMLTINSNCIVTVKDHNPFNILVYPQNFIKLPFTYPDDLRQILLQSLQLEGISQPLIDYGKQILKESDYITIPFATNLTVKINADFTVESRLKGEPYKADKTFSLKKASCRDLSWMQIQLFRHMGIAARFVSGYYYIPVEDPKFELHGWVEVFLPGAGWIGLDPSNGIMAGNSHIAISTSARFENTMPVSGSIRGSATSSLDSVLSIEASS